jgi:hypothetical protein
MCLKGAEFGVFVCVLGVVGFMSTFVFQFQGGPRRSMEDMKARYFSLARALLVHPLTDLVIAFHVIGMYVLKLSSHSPNSLLLVS